MSRSEALPDIPALSEFVPGYEAVAFGGIGVPRNTPVEVVSKLNNEINAVLSEGKVKARFAELGAQTIVSSPAD